MHMNHHSSEEMNFVVSLRQAWFAPFAKVIFFMPLPLIGFDPLITVVVGIASTFWGVIGHTQWINKLGPLEYIFVTPSHHRVHHGSNDQYHLKLRFETAQKHALLSRDYFDFKNFIPTLSSNK